MTKTTGFIRAFMAAASLALAVAPAFADGKMPLYKNPDAPVEERVADLLSRMTPEEKAGQLCCPMGWESCAKDADGAVRLTEYFTGIAGDVPPGAVWAVLRADPWTQRTLDNGLWPRDAVRAVNLMQEYMMTRTRLGIPLLIAEECAHGLMAIGATTYPTGLLQASCWNPQLLREMGQAIGDEAGALGASLCFGPVMDVACDPRWSRMEEGFGEDPFLSGKCGAAVVAGMCSRGVVPVLKHFAGYGASRGGHNGAPVDMGRAGMLNGQLPQFREAAGAGQVAVMTSYNSVDGVPSTCNKWLLDEVLRGSWGFGGMVMSDLFSIDGIAGAGVAADRKDAAVKALEAGVDMDLGAACYPRLAEALREGLVTQAQLDSAVARVLRLKFRLGLFENPYFTEIETPVRDEHRRIALEIVRQGTVLLKNDGVLPLSAAPGRVAVVGPDAGVANNQLGDYTAPQPEGKVVTVAEAIARRLPEGMTRYVRGCAVRDTSATDLEAVAEAVRWADVTVVVVGGSSARDAGTSFEQTGAAGASAAVSDMDCGEGFDRATLGLLGDQQRLLECVAEQGKPFVVIYVQGRPLDMEFASERADALLTAWYPGEMGGEGIADVLFGVCDASGRLPVAVPRSAGQLPMAYGMPTGDYMDMPGGPLYPFGYGLSYTEFAYSGMKVDADGMGLECVVTNTGRRSGIEVVQLYVGDPVAQISRSKLMLRGFERVELKPGESRKVRFSLEWDDLEYSTADGRTVREGGEYVYCIGSSSADIRLKATALVKEP